MRVVVGVAVAAWCAAALGCYTATGYLPLKLGYRSSSSQSVGLTETPAPAVSCRIGIATVADRHSDATSGFHDSGADPVLRDQVIAWVHDGLATLVDQRLAGWATYLGVPEMLAPADRGIVAGVSVRRLYAHTLSAAIEGVVALQVRYTRRDGGTLVRDYRASVTKINWFSGDSEIQDVLNRALDDAVQQMAGDLRVVCATLAAR